MKVFCLCVAFSLTVGAVGGVTVNGDCSTNICDQGLTCQNKVCMKPVMGSCTETSDCVDNAVCISRRGSTGTSVLLCTCSSERAGRGGAVTTGPTTGPTTSASPPCSDNSACSKDSVCHERVCKKKADAACTSSAECVAYSKCVSGNCTCDDGFNSIKNNDRCVKPLLEPCKQNSECVPQAQGMNRTGTNAPECLCQSPSDETVNRVKSMLEPCKLSSECVPHAHCMNKAGTIARVCLCQRGYAMTRDKMSCLSMRPKPGGGGVSSRCSGSCSDGLTCQKGICKRKTNTTCATSLECVTNARCSDKKCKCLPGFKNTKNDDRCVKAVLQSCTQTSDCVDYAECQRTPPGSKLGSGVCKCQRGHTMTPQRLACKPSGGVRLNGDCSDKKCGSGLVCHRNFCKVPLGGDCQLGRGECMTNARCQMGFCRCPVPFRSLNKNTECAKTENTQCLRDTECVMNAECRFITTPTHKPKINLPKPKKPKKPKESSHHKTRRDVNNLRRDERDLNTVNDDNPLRRYIRATQMKCRCQTGFDWSSQALGCTNGAGKEVVAASFLLLTAIFVTSYLL